jgi:hypothetical protein
LFSFNFQIHSDGSVSFEYFFIEKPIVVLVSLFKVGCCHADVVLYTSFVLLQWTCVPFVHEVLKRKNAQYHIDREEIVHLHQKVATTACFIQEESSGG